MAIEIPIPSGLTPSQVLDDVAAILGAGIGLLLPEDQARLATMIVNAVDDAAKVLLNKPSADEVLKAEVDAEQAAFAAAEAAKFPKG